MFKELYKDSIVKSLKDEFNYGNIMQVPKLIKVCINMGVGGAATDSKVINEPFDSLYLNAPMCRIKCECILFEEFSLMCSNPFTIPVYCF